MGAAAADELPRQPAAVDPALAGLDPTAIARRADDVMRGNRTYFEAVMTVRSPPRSLRFRSWHDRRNDRSFVRILSPAKHAGTGFLRLPPNLWSYAARAGRIARIPPERMLQPWMQSDFTNDDVMNASSDIADYEHRLLRIAEDADGREGLRAYVLEYVPREAVPGPWGKIVGWIEVEHATPLRRDFYDEAGVRVRTLRFEEVREVGERRVPHRWIMVPAGEPGHGTRVELSEISFDPVFDDAIFTTRSLKLK
jgi:outer membrane lipoprotein-sorting protein